MSWGAAASGLEPSGWPSGTLALAAGGADDARNGLTLYGNHHRALEVAMVGINPDTGEFVCSDSVAHLGILSVTRRSLSDLPAQPPRGCAAGMSHRLLKLGGGSSA